MADELINVLIDFWPNNNSSVTNRSITKIKIGNLKGDDDDTAHQVEVFAIFPYK